MKRYYLTNDNEVLLFIHTSCPNDSFFYYTYLTVKDNMVEVIAIAILLLIDIFLIAHQ